MNHDAAWWEARAVRRYREVRKLRATLAGVQAALDRHEDCWPDCPCLELAAEIRAVFGGVA